MFLHVSVILSTGWGVVVSQHALQVSRPTPRGEVEGSGRGRGSPGPHPRRKLRGLAWGVVSRPIPGGGLLQGGLLLGGCLLPGGCVCSQGGVWRPPCDGYCCGRYASYWNAFLLNLFCELSKIDLLIVKDCPILVLVLMTRSPRLILYLASDIGWPNLETCSNLST